MKIGTPRILFLNRFLQAVNITDNNGGRIRIAEKAKVFFGGCRAAVSEHILSDHQKSLTAEPLHERGITPDILGHAVRDLQNAYRITFRNVFHTMNRRLLPVA